MALKELSRAVKKGGHREEGCEDDGFETVFEKHNGPSTGTAECFKTLGVKTLEEDIRQKKMIEDHIHYTSLSSMAFRK